VIEAISVGSFLIPTRPVSLLAAVAVAIVASGVLAGRAGLDAKWASTVTESSALAGLIGARLVFVVFNLSVYRDNPWTALYLWQPGYNPWAGMVLGLVFASWQLGRRSSTQRRSYLNVLGAGSGIGLFVLLGLFLILNLAQQPGILRPGDVIPDFSMESARGENVQLSDLAGRVTILNFWATWCPPCRREMPLLDAVQKEYADRGLVIVGINLSDPRKRVLDYINRVSVDYSIWVDSVKVSSKTTSSRELFQRFGGVGLPTTIFVDRKGVISDIYVGELNRAKLQTSAQALITPAKAQ